MKILSVMTIDPSTASEPPGQQEIEKMGVLLAELRSKGVMIDTGGRSIDQFQAIVSRKNGKTTVTDGPFTEAKEVVGGFALLEVENREEAIAVSNQLFDVIGDATCHLHEVWPTP